MWRACLFDVASLREGYSAKKGQTGTLLVGARDSDFIYVSPCYQRVVRVLNHRSSPNACCTHARLMVRGTAGASKKERRSDKEGESKFPPSTRAPGIVQPSLLPAGSLGPGLLRMYKARRHACRMRLLETPGILGRGKNSDKDAIVEHEFPCTTHDSD